MSVPPTPVAASERIDYLDVLRGFAVLGILLANIPYMAMAGAIAGGMEPHLGGDGWIDWASHALVYILVDTKFVTLFSLLFGAGLGLMSEKANAVGAPFRLRYVRRLLVLFLFGVAHVVLFWFGDILIAYSLAGFCAMWLRNCRVRTLLWVAGILLVLGAALWGFFAMLDPADYVELRTDASGRVMTLAQTQAAEVEEVRAAFTSSSLAEMASKRIELYLGFLPVLLFIFFPRTLALFLIGIAIAKSGLLQRLAGRPGRLRHAVLAIAAGVAVCSASLWFDEADRPVPQMLGLYFGGLLLAPGYALAIAHWCGSSRWLHLRSRLGAVGRMALTNYLAHSAITSLIFYWFGLFDRLRRHELLLVAGLIFALQLWLCPLWLRAFRFGPLEWLWRILTYWRRFPLRLTRVGEGTV